MSVPFTSTATSRRDGAGSRAARRLVDFFLLPPASERAIPAPEWLPPVSADPRDGAPTGDDCAGSGTPTPTDRGLAADDRLVWRRAAVLGAEQDVPAVAAAVANALAGEGAPLVGCWSPRSVSPEQLPADTGEAPPSNPPALPGARRLAAALTATGMPAVGRGRLAWSALPPDPSAAVKGWTAAPGHAGERRAAVLAIAGPRPDAFDTVLSAQDLIVLVIPEHDAALAAVARAPLEATGATVVTVPPLTGAARLLALAGLGRLPLPHDEDSNTAATRADAEARLS